MDDSRENAQDPPDGSRSRGASDLPRALKPVRFEIESLERTVDQHVARQAELKNRAALSEVATQLAHDIRSPIAALNGVAAKIPVALAEERRLFDSALRRIDAIASDLLERYRSSPRGTPSPEVEDEAAPSRTQDVLLSPVLRALADESRLRYSPADSSHLFFPEPDRWGISARADRDGLSRCLTNLVGNAMDAAGSGGRVEVSCGQDGDAVMIRISDTGPGIPADILPKLFRRGATFGKSGGTGLGLWHAKRSVESWGGHIEIESAPGRGTSILITLQSTAPPPWLASELVLREGQTVVVLDDEDSAHAAWDQRLSAFSVRTVHLRTPEEFRAFEAPEGSVFLLDYQLADRPETGLALAEERGLAPRAIIVTGRHDDPSIQAACVRLGIGIIPKELIARAPVLFSGSGAAPDAVLIDDDPLVRATWSLAAKRAGKDLSAYSDARAFLKESDSIARHVPIYVDSHLGEGVRGEKLLEDLWSRGFTELYLETGLDPTSRRLPPHAKGVQDKNPPWPAS